MQALKSLEAFCWAVLEIAYEPKGDDPLGVPGTHTIPEKGYTSGGLGVKNEVVYREYERMEAELAEFYEEFRARHTKRLWELWRLEKRRCETCGNVFRGYQDDKECYVCRRGE